MSDQAASAITKVRKLRLPAWYLPNGTKYASEDQLDAGSSSCENWGLVCGALVVAAVAAEIVIAWIEPPYTIFLRLSVPTDVAVALGIIGEVLLGMRNNRLQTELRKRSDDRLTRATLELARLATPRADVIAPHKEEIIAKLLPFEGTKFDVAHSKCGREEWDFLWWLEEIIEKGKWVFVEWNPGPLPHPGVFPKRNWTMLVHTYGVTNVSDVVIQLDDEYRETLLPAATALADALGGAGIRANVALMNINWNSATKDALHVLVGQKG